MKRIIVYLTFLSLMAFFVFSNKNKYRKPSSRPNFDRALRETTRAILKTSPMRKYKRKLEQSAFSTISSYSGLEEDTIKQSLPIIKTLATGKISTEGVRINWRPVENINIQPQIEYDFRSDQFNGSFQLNWEF